MPTSPTGPVRNVVPELDGVWSSSVVCCPAPWRWAASDAAHMATDVLGLGLALAAIQLGQQARSVQ